MEWGRGRERVGGRGEVGRAIMRSRTFNTRGVLFIDLKEKREREKKMKRYKTKIITTKVKYK